MSAPRFGISATSMPSTRSRNARRAPHSITRLCPRCRKGVAVVLRYSVTTLRHAVSVATRPDRRPRALERQRRARARVDKTKPRRVQRHAWWRRRERPSITRVADYRRSDLDHVQPDLMGPPVSRRQATSVARSPNRSRTSTCVTARRPAHGPVDDLHVRRKRARDQRQIRPLQVVVAKPARQLDVRVRGLREHDQPAGLEIDPMDDEHRRRARAARRAYRPGCCGRSPAWAPSAARRLVDDDDVVVFEHDRVRPAAGARRRCAPHVRSPSSRATSAPPITATTSSPLCIGRPAIFTRRPPTNTPPMSSSTRACRRDRPLDPRREHLIQTPPRRRRQRR